MRPTSRAARLGGLLLTAALVMTVTACTSGSKPTTGRGGDSSATGGPATASAASPTPTPTDTRPPGEFTFNFAGDVNFSERTATRLAADPQTAFGVAAAPLAAADLTMVNLETAIATQGAPENKSFTFRAPPTAFTALRAAGVDVATMANNHAADYGASGLQETLAAIQSSGLPTVGVGANAAAAYAPWTTTVRGTKLAVIAATQVRDETLAHFTAGASSPGVASAFSPLLIDSVKAAKAAGDVVVVYLHWGTEYTQCPNSDQTALAATLAAAGASAVVGTHAHVLQGSGWRADGTYVAYGLGNYLWWMSFGNEQDDNGILSLNFAGGKVVGASFAPARLDDTGVPVPATSADAQRINGYLEQRRQCANLLPAPPR